MSAHHEMSCTKRGKETSGLALLEQSRPRCRIDALDICHTRRPAYDSMGRDMQGDGGIYHVPT